MLLLRRRATTRRPSSRSRTACPSRKMCRGRWAARTSSSRS